MMVWASSQRFYEAVMMSQKKDGEWTVPVNITPQIRSDGDLFPTGLSADGNTLLLVKRAKSGGDIWYSQFDGMIWSPAVQLHGEVNSNADEAHASFHPDGSRIYVSSDRRGTLGELDIFYSDKLPDGRWSKPKNMGDSINTKRNETSAYITPDGSRMIFSSEGHFNMGGYDIFSSTIMADQGWDSPNNLGFPMNTTSDNIYFVPLKDGRSGLYSRYTNEGVGMFDLWFMEEDASGQTLSSSMNRVKQKHFAIIVVDNNTGEEIELIYDPSSDSFRVLSEPGKSYKAYFFQEN